MDKSDLEYYLIDACANLAGTIVPELYERGQLGHYTAIVEEAVSPFEDNVYELDIITELMDGWTEDAIVAELTMRLREVTGQYEG
jgi:hypothetical protein